MNHDFKHLAHKERKSLLGRLARRYLAPALFLGGLSGAVIYGAKIDKSEPVFEGYPLNDKYDNMELVDYKIPTRGTVDKIGLMPFERYIIVKNESDQSIEIKGKMNYCIRESLSVNGIHGCALRDGYVKLMPKLESMVGKE